MAVTATAGSPEEKRDGTGAPPCRARATTAGLACTGVARARAMMYADHYGWFERPPSTARGTCGLTPKGRAALEEYADELSNL